MSESSGPNYIYHFDDQNNDRMLQGPYGRLNLFQHHIRASCLSVVFFFGTEDADKETRLLTDLLHQKYQQVKTIYTVGKNMRDLQTRRKRTTFFFYFCKNRR